MSRKRANVEPGKMGRMNLTISAPAMALLQVLEERGIEVNCSEAASRAIIDRCTRMLEELRDPPVKCGRCLGRGIVRRSANRKRVRR